MDTVIEWLSTAGAWVAAHPVQAAVGVYAAVCVFVAMTPTKRDDEALERAEAAAAALPSKLMALLERIALFRRGSAKLPGSR